MAETRNFPITKNGHEIPLRTTTDHVIYTDRATPTEITLTQKIDSVSEETKALNNTEEENKIKFSNKDYEDNVPYKKFTIINHKGRTFMSLRDVTSLPPRDNSYYWLPLSRRRKNVCLIEERYTSGKDKEIISDYAYTFNDLSNMLTNNDYYRYIQNGDYIKIIYLNYILTLTANIDTYMNNFFHNQHCIDFICTGVESITRDNGANALSFDLDPNISTNIYIENGIRPMVLKDFLGRSWSMDALINGTTPGFISESFTRHIVDKHKNVVTRRYDKNNNTIENLKDYGIAEVNLGKTWMLYEAEIKGYNGISSVNDMMLCQQYPIFQKYQNRGFKFDNNYFGILTSSSLRSYDPTEVSSGGPPDTSNLNMIYIKNNVSRIYSKLDKVFVFPMFGMRFV